MADISNNIRKLRKEQGLSQEQLAERIGVTRQTVSSWERGTSFPDLGMLEKLAGAFQTAPVRLLDPASSARPKKRPVKPVPYRFVLVSVILYLFLFYLGAALLDRVFGAATIYIWPLILLVCFIAICTCLIMEHISDCLDPDTAGDEEDEPEEEPQKKADDSPEDTPAP